MAAGALIAQEGGGRISDFKNGEFSIFDSEILATNGLIHQQMVDVLLMENAKVKNEQQKQKI
jgi:myo-inositol-1(or 4)-monophosphatase